MTEPLPFRLFDECLNEPPKPWIIKGVVAHDEDSTWYGPPGSMKSATLTDMAVHVAAGRDWRTFQTKRPVGVVFFALERAGLTRRRLAAYGMRDGHTKLPIAVVDRIIDLMDPESVNVVVTTVQAAQQRFGCPVGLIILDTWSKAIAAGMADEDKAQHQNIAAANLKMIHEGLSHPVHIASIGHTGKDEKRGERGSNARVGHVDLAVQISGDHVKTATIVKGNDQAEGPLTSFAMEEITVGQDEDGEPLKVGILSATEAAAAPRKTKLSARQANALGALRRIGGTIQIEQWREELFRCGVIEGDAKNPREVFRRIKNDLTNAGLMVERDGVVHLAEGGLPIVTGAPSMPIVNATVISPPPGGIPSLPPFPPPRLS